MAPVLQEAGHEVTGLDTFFCKGCDLLDDALDFPPLRADVRDVRTDMLEGFDGIVHLAALSNDPLGELDEELTRDINLRGTVELAWKAKEAGVPRFVLASSCSMYAASGTNDLMTEEAPLRPLTAYAESKSRPRKNCPDSRTMTSPRSSCGTPQPTVPRRAVASMWCSITSLPGPSRPARF